MQTAILYATSLGLEPIIGGPVEYTDIDDKASQVGDGNTDWNQILLHNKDLWKTELGINEKRLQQN
jgi:hypothetical protein